MNHPEDRTKYVEEWLDAALERHGHAEPPPGLASRIVGNLRAQRERAARRWAWGMGLGLAAAVLLAAVSGGLMNRKERGDAGVKTAPGETAAPSMRVVISGNREMAKSGLNPDVNFRASRAAGRAAEGNKTAKTITATASKPQDEPRLGQFPSSRPGSEQARLLAAYLGNAQGGELAAVAATTNSMEDLAISDLSVTPLSGPAENSEEER